MKPVIMRIVVDLPAPLGPRNPSTSPRPTSNETPSTARFDPKDLLRFSTLITAHLSETTTCRAEGAASPLPAYTDLRPRTEVPWRAEPDSNAPGVGHKQITRVHESKCICLFKDLRFQGAARRPYNFRLSRAPATGGAEPCKGLRDDPRRNRELHQMQIHGLRRRLPGRLLPRGAQHAGDRPRRVHRL